MLTNSVSYLFSVPSTSVMSPVPCSNGHDASKDLKKTCFNCGEIGHIDRFCPKPVVSISQHDSSAARKMVTEVNIALGTLVLEAFSTFDFGFISCCLQLKKAPMA